MHRIFPLLVLLGTACTVSREPPQLIGQDVRLTLIHTSDIHSRLFPYNFVPNIFDQKFGLKTGEGPFGGIARMGAIVKDIRRTSARSLWLDSGDCFQGAPVFNLYRGEAEFRALSELGLDAAVIGNHEFDLGSHNLYEQIVTWARFPLLAANYVFDDPSEPKSPKLREAVRPFQLFDAGGVRVAAIGMANWSSMTSIFEGGNSLGLRPLDDGETVETYVRLLRPLADVVVLVSHLGLDEDEDLGAQDVEDENEALASGCGGKSCLDGVDVILGGHLHIVLNPPKVVQRDAYDHPTVLAHSGAFAKYVGRLDLVVRMGKDNANPAERSHIATFSYENLPVSCGPREDPKHQACPNPVDADTVALLQPYSLELNKILDLDGVFAYVNAAGRGKITRTDPSGGDSQLGNLVARAMQKRPGVDADFAMTNSLGIRTDFEHGPLTLEQVYNVFPFENTITIMYLSGREVLETLDFVARKSAARGCKSQVQVAGLWFTMSCRDFQVAKDSVYVGEDCRLGDGSIDPTRCAPLLPEGLYRVAVNDYMAAGGSGFSVLKRNTSKQNTGISLRAALVDFIRGLPDCPVTLLDGTDSTRSVVANYGPITCLDETSEPHDARILPRFE
jgi:2',3'-cyclic-nucleotide 2'-phosphodiesterase (5'-nucleotidase family)